MLRVRLAEERDVEECNKLCRDVHGFDRHLELRDAIRARSASGRTFKRGHVICNGDWLPRSRRRSHKSRFEGSDWRGNRFSGPGFLLLSRNHEVFEWCLSCELKLVFQMALMTTGLYNEPAGAYLPSILY